MIDETENQLSFETPGIHPEDDPELEKQVDGAYSYLDKMKNII